MQVSVRIEEVSKEQLRASLRIQRDDDRKMVKGRFMFHECPKGEMSFTFRKHKGDPVENYVMKDGEIYTVPLGVAKHLNTNCWYPTYTFKNDEAGRPVTTLSERVRRCSFQSLEFTE